MKMILPLLVTVFIVSLACSGHASHHKKSMPDPKSFNGHFGDIDADGDDRVDWKEFKAHFPHAEPGVFQTIDQNEDGRLDHDEWHEFKQAHGLKHHD